MAYGNNRGGQQPRATFQLAGGSIIKFRHPYFAGLINSDSGLAIDEIDISRSCKLEGRFFEANQNQDSAHQVVLVDGSVVTISNKMLNGTITIPAVKTTGLIGTGDFISACQLIQSIGDSVGGLITKTDYLNGNAITRVYYGVTVKSCPADISEGNDVAVYNIQLLYAGWIEAVSSSSDKNKKRIWAVGSKEGIEGFYNPYGIQNSNGNGATGETNMASTAILPKGTANVADDGSADVDNSKEIADLIKNGSSFAKVVKGSSITFATKAPESDSNPQKDSSGSPSNTPAS